MKTKSALMPLALLAGLFLQPADLQAQAWPQKPIMFVVPFAPGGGTDAFARPLAAQLDSQLGQRVLIENKAGAGGTLGASYASKQAADGYTFLIGAAHHTIAPSIYPKLDYDIEKDFVPVIMLARPPHVVTVNPGKIQAKTLKEFIAYTQNNQVNYGSAGAGTTHHLAGEFFNIDGEDQAQPRALSRRRSGDAGSARRSRAGGVRRAWHLRPADRRGHAARACDHRAEAGAGNTGCADVCRSRAAGF